MTAVDAMVPDQDQMAASCSGIGCPALCKLFRVPQHARLAKFRNFWFRSHLATRKPKPVAAPEEPTTLKIEKIPCRFRDAPTPGTYHLQTQKAPHYENSPSWSLVR